MRRQTSIALALFCLLCAGVGYFLADQYTPRLAHHRGYFQVSVADRIAQPPPRPRHTLFVLIDGLREDHAARMSVLQTVRQQGQCRRMDVGPESVSRPVYTVLSTGLEQDRTGVRNNANESPIAADSFWQSAHRAGLRVTGVAELPWFQQLFPDAFDSYRLVDRAADHFTPSDLADLSLISPIYVDEAAHEHGARSPQYVAAVARANEELGRLVARLDLKQDLLLVTADHGHSDRGGHGARSPEVAQVMTCFAGRGVLQRSDLAPLDARTVAPTLSVLLGVPLPRNLRAGLPDKKGIAQDELDSIWDIVDPAAYPADYLTDRRATVDRFRRENSQQLARWLEPGATWNDLYAREARAQALRAFLFLAAVAALCLPFRRRIFPAQPSSFFLWTFGAGAGLVGLYTVVRGSFDMTSVNERGEFITRGSAVCFVVGTAALLLHHRIWRDRQRLASDQIRLTALLLLGNLTHVVAYGWPLGFPLPGVTLFFFPLIGGLALIWCGLLGLVALIPIWRAADAHAGDRAPSTR